ncbi:MAG TPA: M24 family metallopeptidase, partial [Planctomycetes bacterium]|nr:M24 family metallopeptidase [Planctomycetota bacterium]
PGRLHVAEQPAAGKAIEETGHRRVQPNPGEVDEEAPAELSDIDRAAREVVREEGFGEFFPHGTSHHVGLDVHDVGPRRPLIAGMVVTVEPGIYIAAEGLGVRIEDMVLVTAEGCEVLSAAIPKEAEAMERWVKAGQATPF